MSGALRWEVESYSGRVVAITKGGCWLVVVPQARSEGFWWDFDAADPEWDRCGPADTLPQAQAKAVEAWEAWKRGTK